MVIDMTSHETSHIHDDVGAGDMNGPVCYWGPVARTPATPRSRSTVALSRPEREAIERFSHTLRGRTWAGTNRLMDLLMTSPS